MTYDKTAADNVRRVVNNASYWKFIQDITRYKNNEYLQRIQSFFFFSYSNCFRVTDVYDSQKKKKSLFPTNQY